MTRFVEDPRPNPFIKIFRVYEFSWIRTLKNTVTQYWAYFQKIGNAYWRDSKIRNVRCFQHLADSLEATSPKKSAIIHFQPAIFHTVNPLLYIFQRLAQDYDRNRDLHVNEVVSFTSSASIMPEDTVRGVQCSDKRFV